MLRKLSFLLITAILLTGCGASAPIASDNAKPDSTSQFIEESAIPETVPTGATSETVAEAPMECPAEYFTFTARNSTVTNDDGVTILIENQTIPTFTSSDPERSAWVENILTEIDQDYRTNSENLDTYAREFVSENGTDYFYSYSYYQQLGIARHDNRVASLIALSSLYSGGSHPNSVQVA